MEASKRWAHIFKVCQRRNIAVERIVQRRVYGKSQYDIQTCDDEATCAIRRAVFKELVTLGLTPLEIASMAGMTVQGARKALR